MTAFEGSFTTPLGAVPKKAALLIGGGLALLIGVMYYRGKQQPVTSATAGVGADINPATGFPFGSPEDVAALAAQGGAIGPVGGGGGGGGGGDVPIGTGFTNNAQWVQSTIAGMTNSGIIEDPSALSVALGKYIAGQPVGDSAVTRSLIEQATAFNGPPPLAGPNGYPPSINTANPNGTPTPTPTSTATTATAPANTNLYDWCTSMGVSFTALFGTKKGDMNCLNPKARYVMHWDVTKSPQIPTFTSPQTLRIR